jgi:vacuolar protein sorting-associated protein 1
MYQPEVLDDLLKESEYVINRRREVVKMLEALAKADEVCATV